ncbi:MAG: hypothetical protein WCF23_06455 [Candidatus Nitrosopolaris sp.]
MKQQIPITISIAAIISASICAIAAASAQAQFSTFTGPDGKFSIGHPSDWLERQVVRPPSLFGLIFTSPNDMRTNVTLSHIPNATLLFSNPDIATLFSTFVNSLQRHNNAIISKPIDCNTYKVENNRACTATVQMVGSSGTQFQKMALWTSINGTIYALQFTDTQGDFNQTLPVFLQMLLTFHSK